MSRIGDSLETENRLVIGRARRGRNINMEMVMNVSLWGVMERSGMDSSDGYITKTYKIAFLRGLYSM